MTDAVAEAPEEEKPAKSSKLPLIVGLVLGLTGAGGGYFAVTSGILPFGPKADQSEAGQEAVGTHEQDAGNSLTEGTPKPLPEIAYVPVEPIVVTLLKGSNVQHLRFRAQLEVVEKYKQDVEKVLPRVTDVLNGYLRALEVRDLEDPLALTRLRAQMLRRIQIVTGKGRVRDLLIMDFVLN